MGTLERPEFYRLYAYFIEESRIHRDRTYRQDVFTEAADGRLLPKHPVIISVMAAPFYGWMGQVGFWVFQQLVLLALIISLYRVARDLAGPEAALLTCALAAAGTNLVWYYSYNFSYDIPGTMFIMAGLSYLKRYPLLAGTLFALSLYVRAANVVVLPFLVLACWPPGTDFRGILRPWILVMSGFLAVILPYLALNHLIYGDALKGNYSLIPVFAQGKVLYDVETTDFSWRFFREEALARLWGHPESVLYAYPGLFVSILSLPWILRLPGRERRFAVLLFLAGCSMIVLFFCYSGWLKAHGDRYVLPAAFLMLIPTALVFRRLSNALQSRLKKG